MTDSYEAVVATVRNRVEPTAEDYEHLERTVTTLLDRAATAISDRDLHAEALHTGSTARDTWLRGDRDIDIFIQFPPTLPASTLEQTGLSIGHAILDNGTEEYAEHPYVTGSLNGFDVDIVPCYAVDSPRQIVTSVDRTPFHSQYLDAHLTEDHTNEIRVFKQFLTGIGIYGSDLRTQGFSGYLTELLVLSFDTLHDLLVAAADWSPPVIIDPEDHAERAFDDPLIVIDPTDPTRNVAAVLSERNLARFQHYARRFLDTPSLDLFFPPPRDSLSPSDLSDHLARRETTPLAIVFDTPDLVEDELYPQLRKSLRGITDALAREEFEIVRSTVFANDRSVLFIELASLSRPAITRHAGPPLAVRDHADAFLAKYVDTDVYGPFIEDDRYVIERTRDITDAPTYLEATPFDQLRLGPAVKTALEQEYDLVVGDNTTRLLDEFARELTDYFVPTP